MNKEPADTLTTPSAKVAHIHCAGDGGFTAEHVAKCSLIPNVVAKPTDVIGHVDAVIIATDIGAALKRGDVQKQLRGPVAHSGFRRLTG